jgi:dihydroxy-acid dehydratase
VRDGDRIVIDAKKKAVEWFVNDAEQERRREEWEKGEGGRLSVRRGVLYRYARDVQVSVLFSAFLACAFR